MFHSRSRAAVTGAATGAAVLLAVPVMALAQVPGVDQVVGGVNQAAQDVVQAAPAPPVRLPAPAPAPTPAAPAPAPAASAPAPSAPATAAAPTRSATASGSQASGGTTSAHPAGGKSSTAGGHSGGVRAHAAAGGASASQTDTQIADAPASVPRDASPDTLPFTGLQLALMLLAGMAALAAGSVLRRTARP